MSSSGAPRKWSGRNPKDAKLRSTSRTNASRIASRPSWLPAPGKFSPFGPDHVTSSENAARKRSISPCPNAFSASSTASARLPTSVASGVSPAPTVCLACSTRLFARCPSPLLSSDIRAPPGWSARDGPIPPAPPDYPALRERGPRLHGGPRRKPVSVAVGPDVGQCALDAGAHDPLGLHEEQRGDAGGEAAHADADPREVHDPEPLRPQDVGRVVRVLDGEDARLGARPEDHRDVLEAARHALPQPQPDRLRDDVGEIAGRP